MERKITLFFGYFILLCNSAQADINQGIEMPSSKVQTRCTFMGKHFLPGEVWRANTSSSASWCVMCQCLQSGKLNCTNLECCGDNGSSNGGGGGGGGGGGEGGGGGNSNISVDLVSGVTKANSEGINACCETCGRRSSSAMRASTAETFSQDEKDSSSSHYYDEETDDPLVKANLEHVSCFHQGQIYRDREVFAANMSALPIWDGRDHCMHCVCQGGMVLCNMDPCSGFDCAKNVTSIIMKACCEKCNADRQSVNIKTVSESGQKPKSAERQGDMNDIADDQYSYTPVSMGEQTNKAAGPAIISPEQKHFVVNHRLLSPTKRAGCVSSGKFHFHGSTWHPVIGPFGPMECVVCKCLHSRIECSRLPCPSAAELQCSDLVKLEGHCCPTCIFAPTENVSRQMCAPLYQDVTVYKSQEYFPENDTEVIRMSFVRIKENWNPKFQVEIHEWTLEEGKIFRFYTLYHTIEDFLRSRDKTGVIIGATTSRNLEKFTKREKKLHYRCKVNCNVRIHSLQLTLRLHELTAKKKCSLQERYVI